MTTRREVITLWFIEAKTHDASLVTPAAASSAIRAGL
jgi:hypothetical protein